MPLYGPSGASVHLRGIAGAFQRAGYEVTVAAPRATDRRGPFEDPAVNVVFAEPRRWGWLPRGFRERGERWDGQRLLNAGLDVAQPDLLYERHSLFCDAGADVPLPRLVELNAPLASERAQFGTLRDPAFAEACVRRSLTTATKVIAVSDWLATWAVAAMGCTPGKVRHVPNGVEQRGLGDRDATRERLGLRGLVVGFLGTLRPWHGIERLPALADALPEATFVVIGDGPIPVQEHPRIRPLGRQRADALPDLLAALDVGLAPYPTEAPPWFCPLKILEYRAQGLPVVAADIGDCARLVGEHGRIVPTDAPTAWADAIRQAAALPRLPHTRTWDDVLTEVLR